MKTKFILLLFAFISFSSAIAQTDGISYQAIIIDNNAQEIPGQDVVGNYLSEGAITLKFTILDQFDAIEYQETQNVITDQYGMVNLIIGQGEVLSSGYFDEISWDGTPKILIVAIRYEGSGFEELGKQELLFVPYAFHRNITATGTLIVDDLSTLNNGLTVANQSLTYLTGDLIVDGNGQFNGLTTFNSIIVENQSDLNGILNVGGIATFNNDLNVVNGSSSYFSGDVLIDGVSNLNNNFNVNLGSSSFFSGPVNIEGNTNINGQTNINGATTINNELSVLNGFNSYFSGDLLIDGVSNFNDDAFFQNISVQYTSTLNGPVNVMNESPSFLSGSLLVEGNTTLNSVLTANSNSIFNNQVNVNAGFSVLGSNLSSLSGNLNVDGDATFQQNSTINGASFLNGQVTINADLTGGQTDYNSYALRVEGSDQGIAIKVNGAEDKSKNFVSFLNGSGTIQGRIEGQDLGDLHASSDFIFELIWGGVNTGFEYAESIAAASQLDGFESALMIAKGASESAQLVQYTYKAETRVGVAFESGGADYAEWLEKENVDENFHPGEVVGVYTGKISKKTQGADHVLVVSSNPIVVGNLPENEEFYEKVGFLGQVPIRVIGKVKRADYILASGNNDGIGVAISPENLPTRLFDQIIGVAWEESNEESIKLINTAIGLNSNDISKRVANMENELSILKDELATIKALLSNNSISNESQQVESIPVQASSINSTFAQSLASKPSAYDKMSDEDFEEWLNSYGYIFTDIMGDIKAKLDSDNINYQKYQELAIIVDTPIDALRDMRSGKLLSSMWENFEERRNER